MAALFFVSFFFIIFTYMGYPLVLFVLSRLSPKPIAKNLVGYQPSVSVVIAAKNEAGVIEKRINNLLEQDYPADKLEILVVSDGSTDETHSIVAALAAGRTREQSRIICRSYTPSMGKPTALNIGVALSSGDIVVFADARQRFAGNAVSQLVANFSNPIVGGVSGELLFLDESDSEIKAQMGAYWRYEKGVRKLESISGSVVGATGAIYAVRRHLYQNLPPGTLLDDVLTPMNITFQGYRVVFDGRAHAYDTISKDIRREWQRKIRTLAGNWQLVSLRPELLHPRKNALLFRFFWHKIARILVPFFLLVLLITSIVQQGFFFGLVTLAQVLMYFIAVIAFFFPCAQKNIFVNTIYFFCSLNIAAMVAFFVWLTGGCEKVWINYSRIGGCK